MAIGVSVKVCHFLVKSTFMPRLLFRQLSLSHKADRVLCVPASGLKATGDTVIENGLELLLDLHE